MSAPGRKLALTVMPFKPDPLDCWSDLDAGFVRYGCGFSAPIIAMYDLEGELTFEPAEAVVVVAKVPESHVVLPLYEVAGDDTTEGEPSLN